MELNNLFLQVKLNPQTAEVKIDMSVQVGSENFDLNVDRDKTMTNQVCICFSFFFFILLLVPWLTY